MWDYTLQQDYIFGNSSTAALERKDRIPAGAIDEAERFLRALAKVPANVGTAGIGAPEYSRFNDQRLAFANWLASCEKHIMEVKATLQ